ncbi:hypothetical protein [Streptomyces hebeiensis]
MNLSRPLNTELRSAILGAFDQTPVGTVQNVISHLKELNLKQEEDNTFFKLEKKTKLNTNYHTIRRVMVSMVKEGLLSELPKRGDRNQVYYTKAIFKNTNRLTDYSGNNVSLREFIHTLIDEVNPELINPSAMDVLKIWMLDSLGASIPGAYKSKNREVPKPEELRKKLEATLSMTRTFHAFIKAFLDSDIWSPVAQERLEREFKASCVEEHTAIVDKAWLEK